MQSLSQAMGLFLAKLRVLLPIDLYETVREQIEAEFFLQLGLDSFSIQKLVNNL